MGLDDESDIHFVIIQNGIAMVTTFMANW